MQSAFEAAPQELLVDNDGANATLARLHGQYEAKAEYLSRLEVRPHRKGMYYENAAGAIATLQLQGRPTIGKLYAGPDAASLQVVGDVTSVEITLAQ